MKNSINSLLRLALVASASATIAKSDAEELKVATIGAYEAVASNIVDNMMIGSDYISAARIERDALDSQCNDVIFAAIQNGEVAFGDLSKLIRKADKIASRLMSCAYALVMLAPAGKINDLERFAAHLRRGYALCRVSHMRLDARLAESQSVVTYEDDASTERRAFEARIAELLAANAMISAAKDSAESALAAVIHGGELVGNMGQTRGKQRSKVV